MSTNDLARPSRSYRIGGLRVMMDGGRLCQALDLMPCMLPFADKSLNQYDIRIHECDHLEFQQEHEVFRFDLAEERSECSLWADEAGNLCYRFSSGSMILHDRLNEGDVYLQWQDDLDELRYMLWLSYAHTALEYKAVPIHSSVVVCQGRAVLCLGESGTGKSTHTRLWLNNIEGSHLLNDDSPIVRVESDGIWGYGSPWSGKTPCFRTERFLVGAFMRLEQRPENSIRRLNTLESFIALHPSCPPTLAHDERCTDGVVNFISDIISQVPVFRLGCLPDADAARLAYNTIMECK